MPITWLPSELRGYVLDMCTAKQLVAVQATCHDFRAAARDALDKHRFQERKESAALGALLLAACEEDWFREGYHPPPGSEFCQDFVHLFSQLKNRYWSTYKRDVAVGTFVQTRPRLIEDPEDVQWGYVRAVHEDGTCDLDCDPDDEEEGVNLNVRVRPVWPAPSCMRSGMLAIQDWDPRAFAYFMYKQSDPEEGDLSLNLLLTDVKESYMDPTRLPEDASGGSYLLRACEGPPPPILFKAVCEWDSDVSYDGLSRWLALMYRCLYASTYDATGAADEILNVMFDVIDTMPVEAAARLFDLVWSVDEPGSVWKHAGATLEKDYVIESILARVQIQARDGLGSDHLGQVLHSCQTTPDDMAALIGALCPEDFVDFGAPLGLFFQIVCFGKQGDRDEEVEVLVLNRINETLESCRGASAGRVAEDTRIPEEAVQAVGHLLSGFFDSSHACSAKGLGSAADHPPRALMDWLETTGDVSVYGVILREAFDEEGIHGLVSQLDGWGTESMERAAELFAAWHPDGGRPQAVWDMMDALVPPWWSSGRRGKARRERLLHAMRALGFGRS